MRRTRDADTMRGRARGGRLVAGHGHDQGAPASLAIMDAQLTSTAHVVRHLRAQAARVPERVALASPERREGPWPIPFREWRYDELDRRSDALARGFEAIGITRGTKTVLMLPTSDELFVVLLALFKVGAVPVVLDPGMGIPRMLHCYRSIRPEAFIGIRLAHWVRRLGRRAFATVRITVGDIAVAGGEYHLGELYRDETPSLPLFDARADDLLMIVFTTGSTGPAKGVEYTHRMLDALVEQVRSAYPLDDGEAGLITLSLFTLVDLFTGCTAVLAPMDPTRPAEVDPALMARTIERFGVRHMFGSPALLRRMAPSLGEHQGALETLRTVVCGGAAAPLPVLRAFREAMGRDALVHTTYGSTEALPIATISLEELEDGRAARRDAGEGVCVGKPIAGMRARPIRIDDAPIPRWDEDLVVARGEIGEITLSGPVVSARYHLSPAHDAAHKIPDEGGVWHRTGDVGWLDDEERIWLCGRKAQIVRTAEGPRFTLQCEGVFDALPEVRRSALVGVGPRGAARPVVCVELEADATWNDALLARLRERADAHPCTRGLSRFLVHPEFPVDVRHNAKIGREDLAVWAGVQLGWLDIPPARRALMIIPLIGWLYLLLALLVPLTHPALVALFWVVVFLHFVVHPLQILPGLPVGKRIGHGRARVAWMTVIFGATYWKNWQAVRADRADWADCADMELDP